MNELITVAINGKRESAIAGQTLSEIVKGEKPCGGHGRCGKCKIKARGEISAPADAELKLLSTDELNDGIRLACLTYALGECEIETFDESRKERIVTGGDLPEFKIAPAFEKYGVAIDIGTTTLAARLYDRAGKLLADASCLNPQQKWGADVISRIEASLDGKSRDLSKSIREAIDSLIFELAAIGGIDSKNIDGAVVTGNTVMLSLLAEESVEPFSHAPFDVKRLFGETITAESLELSAINEQTPIYFPPCISAFVGADTTCAILATELCKDNTALLTDIGTNGEIALWHNGKLSVCSTAAGPAFEGVGISMGMRGSDGAIDKVVIVNGTLNAHVIGNVRPVGICGSGLVDAVACMLNLDIVDESGYIEDEKTVIQAPVCLTPQDIRMLQLAKSAICAGIMTLIEVEGVDPSVISKFCIAGGFGSYLNRKNAVKIGLIPKALSEKMKTVGNAALGGAAIMLLDKNSRSQAEYLAKSTTTVELSANPLFSEKYMNSMMLEEV